MRALGAGEPVEVWTAPGKCHFSLPRELRIAARNPSSRPHISPSRVLSVHWFTIFRRLLAPVARAYLVTAGEVIVGTSNQNAGLALIELVITWRCSLSP